MSSSGWPKGGQRRTKWSKEDILLKGGRLACMAGVKASGNKLLSYYELLHAFDPSGNQSYQDYFFTLRDAHEDCLITVASKIKFQKETLTADEELTPTIESRIVLDWINSIGGPALVRHIFKVFSKDLEDTSLADLQERICDSLPILIAESEESPSIPIQRTFPRPNNRGPPQNPNNRGPPQRNFNQGRAIRSKSPFGRKQPQESRQQGGTPCALCKAKNRPQAKNHSIADCFLLSLDDRKAIIRAAGVTDSDSFGDESEFNDEEYEDDDENSRT